MPAITPTPYAGDIIRLAWFYKLPASTQEDLVVKKPDFYILTHKDETERSQLKAKGVTVPISQCLLFLVINALASTGLRFLLPLGTKKLV